MKRKQNVILGVDPGLNKTGWAIINSYANFDTHIAHGEIITKSNQELGKRLSIIYDKLLKVFNMFSPNAVAVEKIFANQNPESSLKLGKARGMVYLVAAKNDLIIHEYSPNTVKKNLVGYGHANKEQILKMLKRIFPELSLSSEDAADAMAVAICHSMQNNSKLSKLV